MSGRVSTSATMVVAAAVVSVGVLGVSPTPVPNRLAAQLTSAAHAAAGTVQHAETALHDGLKATGPTIASLLATSPGALSTTSLHQLAAVATNPAAIKPLLASGAVVGGAGAGQVLAANALAGLPTVNPADVDAVTGAIQALIDQFLVSFLKAPAAIGVALQRVAQGNVNGAFESLEDLVIQPIKLFVASKYPQQAANAIGRYVYSQVAAAVIAAPKIFSAQEDRIFDLFTSARASVVDAVQGVISSLGTLNPAAIAGAVTAGLSNIANTAVANTFGPDGGFAIARDVVNALFKAAFPDPPAVTNTVVTNTAVALTTRASSTTTSAQSSTGTTESSPSTTTHVESTHVTSAATDDTASGTSTSASDATAAESHTSDTPKVTAQDTPATTDGSTTTHTTAAKPNAKKASTKTVDVTSGNKVQPHDTTGASGTSHGASSDEPSTATDTSATKDSSATATSDTHAAADKSASK
ncbi:hypothetical protein [Mycolicibacterium madagascariense]|uniref:hypothetical protein n=1 Tax=Mycolicibacterium madagascariense TaxID=212765 RepID=UPI0013D00385|nr:hypothetical protein [Mycolicibacterium madagascariense]MCV7013423.1 hypothetical protein [Mycolicibacterium madagascariense]